MNTEFHSLGLPPCCAIAVPVSRGCCRRYNAAVDEAPALISVLADVAEASLRFAFRNAPLALKGAAAARQ